MTRVSHWGTMEYHGAVLKLMTTVSIFQDQICPARQVAGSMIALLATIGLSGIPPVTGYYHVFFNSSIVNLMI